MCLLIAQIIRRDLAEVGSFEELLQRPCVYEAATAGKVDALMARLNGSGRRCAPSAVLT